MSKKVSLAVLLIAAVGLFVTNVSAHTVTSTFSDDFSVGNGSGTLFSNTTPGVRATVYAGNDIAGNVTNTSFTIAWDTIPGEYRIGVRNDCVGANPADRYLNLASTYEAIVSGACTLSPIGSARGFISHPL
jgi:hypothetical protein